jgi:hypothetical protein
MGAQRKIFLLVFMSSQEGLISRRGSVSHGTFWIKKEDPREFVAQWIEHAFPMRGTRVRLPSNSDESGSSKRVKSRKACMAEWSKAADS